MSRNRNNGQSNPQGLVGKDFIWNPFTGKHDYLFGSRGSRNDWVCGSEVSSEVTVTDIQKKSTFFESKPENVVQNVSSNNKSQMDVEPTVKEIPKNPSPSKIIEISPSPEPVPKVIEINSDNEKKEIKKGIQ